MTTDTGNAALLIQIPIEMKRQIRSAAYAREMSMSEWVRVALQRALDE